MGGFHDQYGNYRPDLVADAQKTEIDRLCAELANARLERDNIASLNSSLIAKIAEAMDRLCYTAGECDLVTACEHWVANFHEANVRAERADTRIAELEEAHKDALANVVVTHVERLAAAARAERAEARVAELERLLAYGTDTDAYRRIRSRSELAEAALSFYADERNWHTPPHCYSAAVSDCGTKARTARAPPPAGPDGKSLAVLYCMDRAEAERDALREALEPILRYYCDYLDNDEDGDPNTNRHVAKARAALKISGPP